LLPVGASRKSDGFSELIPDFCSLAFTASNSLVTVSNRASSPDAVECEPELARVRQWLLANVPKSRGFWIEDKGAAVGLHYRQADAVEAAELCRRFSEFVFAAAPRLKLVQLKKISEAMPRSASKAHAVAMVKASIPRAFATVYFGDDSTDEDAFAALADNDVGVLVGETRPTRARYWLTGPSALAVELSQLAEALTRA
jgi:trehalose 6-phosphate phosphatase